MGVIRAVGIRTGVMAMGVIRMGVTPTVVMAMEVIPRGARLTGVNPVRATRKDLAGTTLDSSFGRHMRQDRAEVTMPARAACGLSDCLRGFCTRQGSNLQPYDPKSYTLSN
jgi:hypothetical protein